MAWLDVNANAQHRQADNSKCKWDYYVLEKWQVIEKLRNEKEEELQKKKKHTDIHPFIGCCAHSNSWQLLLNILGIVVVNNNARAYKQRTPNSIFIR